MEALAQLPTTTFGYEALPIQIRLQLKQRPQKQCFIAVVMWRYYYESNF